MKLEYRIIIYILFIFFTLNSCNSQCIEQIDNQKINLENVMTEIYADSFNLSIKNYRDTLIINVEGLPEYTTGEDYNRVLFTYLMYNMNLDSDRCFHKIKFIISHDYNDLNYNFYSDLDKVKWITIDFDAIENYNNITKFILKNFTDLESAYVDLIFEPVSEYYPNFTYDEGLFNLLLKLHAINNGGAAGYSEIEKHKLEFALMWLYYSSDFSFEDLPFPKDRLEEYLKFSGIVIDKKLDRDDINKFYKNNLE